MTTKHVVENLSQFSARSHPAFHFAVSAEPPTVEPPVVQLQSESVKPPATEPQSVEPPAAEPQSVEPPAAEPPFR